MLEDIQVLLKKRQFIYDSVNNNKWDIQSSDISGKGVFTSRNVKVGEIIFTEKPLIIGPRSAPQPTACITCLKIGVPLETCSRGCRLPVCSSQCASAPTHEPECDLMRRLQAREEEHWSPLIYRSLAPLRCLVLSEEEKMIVRNMCQNSENNHVEILMLKSELERWFTHEEQTFLELSCRVLNSVAFEVDLDKVGLGISWRGLFPLAGTMNHSCFPNTQHYYSLEGVTPIMVVIATKDIPEGTEVTTSYCPLLWSTMARRHFLYLTKEFLCSCLRCSDPTEFGTYFSGHKCSCKGYILPLSPLNSKSAWQCSSCGRVFSVKEIIALEVKLLRSSGQGTHSTNFLNVQRKIDDIWQIGNKEKHNSDASEEELLQKEKDIHDVLNVNDRLHLGESRLKVTLLSELKKNIRWTEREQTKMEF